MEGVQILNQYIHEGAVLQPWFTIGLICAVGGLVGALIGGFLADYFKSTWLRVMVGICISAAAIGALIGASAPREEITRYQVLIDEDISFTEFNERYKIIKQEGLIYTIEEREP